MESRNRPVLPCAAGSRFVRGAILAAILATLLGGCATSPGGIGGTGVDTRDCPVGERRAGERCVK